MSLTVTVELPREVEEKARAEGVQFEVPVREAVALELYRKEMISLPELSRMLGLDRFETTALLQRREIYVGALTMEDLEEQQRIMERVMGKVQKK
jgi:predicted HTH domain antitoxin